MASQYLSIVKGMEQLKNPAKAKIMQGFFKTGAGEYGEGDIFLGITVPEQRKIAKKYSSLPLSEIKKLLQSPIHEYRLTALLILVHQFQRGNEKEQNAIFHFYLDNARYINNWDLVDLTADKICGAYLFDKDKKILYTLAKSKNIWERRIAIISTFYFIKQHQFHETLRIAELLLHDKHDLIQKAAGWMLREIGKRNQKAEEEFLKQHYQTMPRTMLRYAIERFPASKRLFYLGKRL